MTSNQGAFALFAFSAAVGCAQLIGEDFQGYRQVEQPTPEDSGAGRDPGAEGRAGAAGSDDAAPVGGADGGSSTSSGSAGGGGGGMNSANGGKDAGGGGRDVAGPRGGADGGNAEKNGGAAGDAGSGGGSEPPSSCVSLGRTCGPLGNEDCCAVDLVDGGSFMAGRDWSPYAFERPAHQVALSDYRLDRYEATVGRFRNFVEAYDAWPRPAPGDGAYRGDTSTGWQPSWNGLLPSNAEALREALTCRQPPWAPDVAGTWSQLPSAQALPITCLNWYLAFAFCIWDGGRLPTEAEWEYAAAGGAEARDYPWGDTWQDGFANYNLYNELISVGTAGAGAGRGRYGHYDLSGNAWEWTRDNWDEGFYGTIAAAGPNPINVAGDGEPITRGGTFYLARPDDEKTFSRSFAYRSSLNPTIGVRCARD